MQHSLYSLTRNCLTLLVTWMLAAVFGGQALAQDEAPLPPLDEDTTLPVSREVYENLYAGEFTPGSGFDLIQTKRGSLNISVYGLFRYVNQMPGSQTFTDHLGRERDVKARNDLDWHRTMIWLTGFFYDQRFRYNITAWSLSTTQQALLFGNLRYIVGEALTLSGCLPRASWGRAAVLAISSITSSSLLALGCRPATPGRIAPLPWISRRMPR